MEALELVMALLYLSVVIQVIVLFYALTRMKVSGSKHLAFVMAVTLVWTLGAFIELLRNDVGWKLFWHNFAQVGEALLPISLLNFAMYYVGKPDKQRRCVSIIVSAIAIPLLLLLLTNHGALQEHASVAYGGDVHSLDVRYTQLGLLLLSYAPMVNFSALVILAGGAVRSAHIVKRQILFVLFGVAIPVLFLTARTFFGIDALLFIPPPIAFIPMGLAMAWSMYRYHMATISPIARNRVFDVIDEGIVVCDHRGHVIDVNKSAVHILCAPSMDPKTQRDISGQRIAPLVGESIRRHCPEWHSLFTNVQDGSLSFELPDRDGLDRNYAVQFYPLYDRSERLIGSISVIRDVTKDLQYQRVLETRAEVDQMTGLLNKSTFESRAIERISQNGSESVLFLIDIDHFKRVNDTYGHRVGDGVIQRLGTILQSATNEDDLLGRLGGDEFAIVFTNVQEEHIDDIAERIRHMVAEASFEYDDLHVTVSIGITRRAGGDDRYEELFSRADEALYRAKARGRNRIHTRVG